MFKIKTLNAISKHGLAKFPNPLYAIDDGSETPDAILLRSADMHAMPLADSVIAIGRAGAGTNNIPVAELSKKGVVVFNAPGANANAVKELVLAGMLMSVRNLAQAQTFVRALDASRADLDAHVEASKKHYVGSELAGKTLGVIGLGAIGVLVANAARSLGMRVLGFDPHMTVEGAWRLSSDVQKAGSVNELYANADFVSFHVPLMAATKGLFNEASLAVVKKGATLLNFSREAIVDEHAARLGLDAGTLSHYVNDFPSHALLAHPKVLSFPHLGASTLEAEENCALMVVDQVREYLENGNIINSVNFPNMQLARAGENRVCVTNRNVPNMIGQLSHVFGAAGLNIHQMQNASRGDYAYNLVDVDQAVSDEVQKQLRAIEGILSVRVI
jgi:D-3-phosphoglycerate dehydrogenase / 2-oxoglutarate reductase